MNFGNRLGIPSGWPDHFQNDDLIKFAVDVTEEVATWWGDRFLDQAPDLFPRELAARLLDRMPGTHSCLYRTIDPARDLVGLEIDGFNGAGEKIWFTGQSIDWKTSTWWKELTDFRQDLQNDGLGTALMGNCFDLALALNMERIKVTAIDAGAYAWIRLGFVPRGDEWNSEVKAKIVTKLEQLKQVRAIDTVTLQKVHGLLTSEEPTTIRKIADERETVPSTKYIEADSKRPLQIPLGRALLAESELSWHGELNFDDEESVRVFERYRRDE